MAPLDDLHSRDLAWISDFVMQQVAIMMHPVMEQLDQADDTADYMQRSVDRMSTDISELRNDVERMNKCMTIMRQGLGLQNESKCALQRTMESTTRTVSRLDDNMDNLVGIVRRVEDTMSQLTHDMRGVDAKHLELAKHASESSTSINNLQSKIEAISIESHALKDDLRNSEARLEVWQRDLRELRRNQLGIAPKFDEKTGRQQPTSSQGCRGTAAMDSWSQKKSLASATSIEMSGKECSTPESDVDSKHKRIGRVSSATRRGLLQPDLKLGSLPSKSSSQAVLYEDMGFIPPQAEDSIFGSHPSSAVGDETNSSSRLPILAKQTNNSRPNDSMYATSVRLRFSETLPRQPSRGSLN